jgi:hypothetical protein
LAPTTELRRGIRIMKVDRKAAIAAYKERKSVPGIFAVRCAATGQAWVGQTPDLTTAPNRIWFALRQDCSRNPSLQSAWNAQAGEGFVLEELERLDDEDRGYVLDANVKARLLFWRATLDALLM